jgi:O-antigen ligase
VRRRSKAADPLLTLLEIGLAVTVFLAPLPFGSVRDPARLGFEIAGLALLVIWSIRTATNGCIPPPRVASMAAAGLIVLAGVQVVPLGGAIVAAVSPNAERMRDATQAPPDLREEEQKLLGVDPESLDLTPTISLSPDSTLEAMRTGACLFALWLVSFTVASERSFRRVGVTLLVAAALQSAYGILVVASGADRIWTVPKEYFLDCATGTFVNRSHFAHFVAVAGTIGTAWLLEAIRRRRSSWGATRWTAWLRNDAVEVWVLAALLLVSVAGLLVSFSRAGTTLGILGVVAVLAAARGFRRRARIVAAIVLVGIALVPLARVGPDRLLRRYADTVDHLSAPMSRPRVWLDTMEMARSFPVAGTGFGTFAAVYPAFRSPEVRYFIDHAHNDLLQSASEGGLIGLSLVLALLVPHALAARRVLRESHDLPAKGLAIALCVALAHALVDFPFHIPATAAIDVSAAGALLGLAWASRS